MAELDETVSKQMSGLVELLTTSGKPTLNPEIMKKFKKICRTSDLYVEHGFVLLMSQLEVDHAEVRLSTYQMMDELFVRSHLFRELLLADFDTFLELTAGTDKKKPLPLPKAVANNMKSNVFKSIQIWYNKFGAAYKKLELGYEFLKSFQKVDFDSIQADLELERRQREENERKLEEARQNRLNKIDQEILDTESEIQLSLTVVENGIQLLLPHPDDFCIPMNDEPGTSEILNKCKSCNNIVTDSNITSLNGKYELNSVNKSVAGFCKSCDSRTIEDEFHSKKHKQCSIESEKEYPQSSTSDTKLCDQGYSQEVNQNDSHMDTVNGNNEETNDEEGSDEMSDVEDEDGHDDMEGVDESGMNKEHGYLDPTFSLTISVGPVSNNLEETEDNTDLIQGVREQYRLIKTKFMPMVKKWIQVLEENNAKTEKKTQVAELKTKLEDAMKKCVELEISSFNHRKQEESDSDDDDDDFEDVPDKDGYEEDIPEHIKLEAEMASTSNTTSKGGKKKGGEKKVKRTKKPMNASTKKIKQLAGELVASRRLLDNDDLDSALLKSKTYKSNSHSFQDELDRTNDQHQSQIKLLEQSSSRTQKGKKQSKIYNSPSTSSSIASSPSKASSSKTVKKDITPNDSHSTTTGDSAKKVDCIADDSERKQSLLDRAPVVPYGVDIEHWETPENITVPVKNKFEGASRFWVAEKDETETAGCSEEVASLTRRTMTFVGDFEPVKWKCRAPVGNGKLCERMDRVKCPFHGKIIGRDTNGMPSNPDDFKSNDKVKDEDIVSSSKGKGKGKSTKKSKEKKNKYANLTDIKVKEDTGRKRLEAKIFNRSTLRRVNKVLDNAAMKKLSEKFGNQFNYSLK
ncbi:hypothetical protein ACF0H5_009858 [Mactra antiquata]